MAFDPTMSALLSDPGHGTGVDNSAGRVNPGGATENQSVGCEARPGCYWKRALNPERDRLRFKKRESRLPGRLALRCGIGQRGSQELERDFRKNARFVHPDNPLGRNNRLAFRVSSTGVPARLQDRFGKDWFAGLMVSVFAEWRMEDRMEWRCMLRGGLRFMIAIDSARQSSPIRYRKGNCQRDRQEILHTRAISSFGVSPGNVKRAG